MSNANTLVEQAEVDLHRGLDVYNAARFVGDEQAAAEASLVIADASKRIGMLRGTSPSAQAKLEAVQRRIRREAAERTASGTTEVPEQRSATAARQAQIQSAQERKRLAGSNVDGSSTGRRKTVIARKAAPGSSGLKSPKAKAASKRNQSEQERAIEQKSSRSRQIAVGPRPDGSWAVQKDGTRRASRVFDRKSDAVVWARSQARRQGVELVVKDQRGRVQKQGQPGSRSTEHQGLSRERKVRSTVD